MCTKRDGLVRDFETLARHSYNEISGDLLTISYNITEHEQSCPICKQEVRDYALGVAPKVPPKTTR